MLAAFKRKTTEPVRRPTLVPNSHPKTRRKPRCKSLPIFRLYPDDEPEAQRQAEVLLHEIQEYSGDAIGRLIPVFDLQRFYGELCARKHWEPKGWCVIGRELGKIVAEKTTKRCGTKRYMAYRIPRAI
ncbi:MAG: hypothetical protein GY877_13645 [Hyphomicrobium sp.]|nr:hypothetical protein [Hyphomicrobium sp.]